MSQPDDFSQSVPPPLDHWYGAPKIDDDNQALLLKKRILRTLEKKELKEAEKLLDKLNAELAVHAVESMLSTFKDLSEEAKQINLQMYNLRQEFKRSNDAEKQSKLREQASILRENMAGIQKDRQALTVKLRPHRAMIKERDLLADRIQEHYSAIVEAKAEKLHKRDMDREARLIAERIILALNKLGFCHRRTVKDIFGNVTEKIEMIRFVRIISKPEEVILQVDVSRLGLLGGHVDNMPHGVYAQDLVKENVLIHLQAALELPVTSPNATGEADYWKGIFYRVDRLGVADGLPPKVSYNNVMKHYPEERRDLMPVPMGVRAGKKINWVYLVSQPHLLVNGVTGYGKSNAMQMFLSTLVSKHSPDEVRFIIADMKQNGDFRWFVNLPHVIGFAGEIHEALELSHALFLEMKRRQKIISKMTNDISEYNANVDPRDRLPHIIYVFDEFPAISINPKMAKEIHGFVAQIAMQGRASGIHMFPSGQQSYSDDFPRTLLANITCQFTARQNTVSGAMATTGNRQTMKMKPVKGRFLFTSTDAAYQVQMPYIEIPDIERCCAAALRWPEPNHFALPDVPHDEDYEATETKRDPESLILETAFTKLDGALKHRQIWEMLEGAVSQPKAKQIIESLIKREVVQYNGEKYEPVKERKFYRLVPIGNTERDTQDDEFEVHTNY